MEKVPSITFTASLMIATCLCGCAITPYEQLGLDTTSGFRAPPSDKAGVYVYQWKSGIVGAGMDVDFELSGQPTIALNTGEYGYMEVPPGEYQYKLIGGLGPVFVPVTFLAGQNYFFRAALVNFSDQVVLVRDQHEIDAAKQNIASGRYEYHDVD
ncbi:MAG: DUF2846 domain-containing protein [Sinimarinibacterium flocculans]|uniref:DUF2846 domain-containing protein n=1 Tax=Sinimarinibacterium flocculans TaxID=985250 RepID=UPI003C3186BD